MTTVPPVTTAQRSIRERVQALGPAVQRLRRPAVLAAAALWPVAAPLLGTGAAVGVTGGLMGLLGGPGQQFITDFLERARGRRERDVRAAFDRALLERLEEGGEMAAALREDIGRLLRQVDGVEVALAATREDTRDALARGLAELGEMWSEFGFMLSQSVRRWRTSRRARWRRSPCDAPSSTCSASSW